MAVIQKLVEHVVRVRVRRGERDGALRVHEGHRDRGGVHRRLVGRDHAAADVRAQDVALGVAGRPGDGRIGEGERGGVVARFGEGAGTAEAGGRGRRARAQRGDEGDQGQRQERTHGTGEERGRSTPGEPDVRKVRASLHATTDPVGPMLPPACRAFLDGLIDYAGLFPPATLALEPALDLYGRYRTGDDAWMLGRFLIPAARLAEADALVESVAGTDPVRVAVLGAVRPAAHGPGVPATDAAAWLADAEAVVAGARAFEARHAGRVTADAFEVRLPTSVARDADALAGALQSLGQHLTADAGHAADRVSVEVPFLSDPDTTEPAAFAAAEANGRLRQPVFALKLRCGGEGVPGVEALATALTEARRAGVAVKATAGLHHPLRHETAEGPRAHGFVNVFGGAVLADVHDLRADDLAEILDSRDAADWALGDVLAWKRLVARPEQIEAARARTALSYGSCSFEEPRDDLRALGVALRRRAGRAGLDSRASLTARPARCPSSRSAVSASSPPSPPRPPRSLSPPRSTPSRPARSTAARCGSSRSRRPSTSPPPTASAPTPRGTSTPASRRLRMPGCSASFVSPHGLVATNHHCAEGAVVAVDRGGEGLLDNGFYRPPPRRRAPRARHDDGPARRHRGRHGRDVGRGRRGHDARGAPAAPSRPPRPRSRTRLLAARGVADVDGGPPPFVVQVVALYNGGRYSAYTFRRYRDVRLVMAPEVRLGSFGGDYDNFTYPRYAADFAFFRVYGDDGRPLASPAYFPLSTTGVARDSVVFVVGNPGSTSRGLTVAELETLRDTELPATNEFIDARVDGAAGLPRDGHGRRTRTACAPQIQSLRNAPEGLPRPPARPPGPRHHRAPPRRRARLPRGQPRGRRAHRPPGGAPGRAPRPRPARPATSRRSSTRATARRRCCARSPSPAATRPRRPRSPTRPAPLERAYLAAELAQIERYVRAQPGRPATTAQDLPVRRHAGRDRRPPARDLGRRRRPETAPGAPVDDPAVALVARLLPDLHGVPGGRRAPRRARGRGAAACSAAPASPPSARPSRPTPRSRSASPTASCRATTTTAPRPRR